MKADVGIHLISSDTLTSGVSVEYCQRREMGIFSRFHLNVLAGDKQSLRGVSLLLNIISSVTSSPTGIINSHGPQLQGMSCTPNKQRNQKKQEACSVSYITGGHFR